MLPAPNPQTVTENYDRAKEAYAAYDVDTDAALERLAGVPISLNCWQGDDVTGFEVREGSVEGGGIMATGGYPYRATNGDQLRQDLDQAIRLIPGTARVNLHAIYAETEGKPVDRDALGPEHFSRWTEWAGERGYGLDFNPSYFAHPKADGGYTLSSADDGIRKFWIDHGKASRRIAAAMGKALKNPCCNNIWIPDGAKDHPVDRWGPRRRLVEALDEIFAEEMPADAIKDALEGKLFGLGLEDYTVGSHEFYLAYCVRHGKILCMDMGHYHPTETITDKLSSILTQVDEVLLHVSRGVRWDSDHVVIFNDEVRAFCHEIVRGGVLDRVLFSLDFFDASINRAAAWVVGARSFLKAMLNALLEPTEKLRQLEAEGKGHAKLGLLQDLKLMPLGAVWNAFCLRHDVPPASGWIAEIDRYEREVLAGR